jgi:Na+/glutamate symporter
MTVDQAIGLAGIVIAVIFGAIAAKKVINRNRTQRQNIGTGGIGIQSGRDTHIKQ